MKNLQLLLVFLLGVLLVLLVVTSLFDFRKVMETLLTVRLDVFFLAILLHFAIIGLLAVRMKIIASHHATIGFARCLKITFLGLFVNFLTPLAKIGGEPVKVLLLQKHTHSSKGWAIVSMDTFVEIICSLITASVIIVVLFSAVPLVLLPYFAVFFIISVFMLIIFLKVSLTYNWTKKIFDFFARYVSRFFNIKKTKKDYVAVFHAAFKELLKNKKAMVTSLAVSFATKFLEFLRIWLIFYALGVDVPFSVILLAWAFLLILFMVPWLPGSLGLIEAGVAFAFMALGVAPYVAASVVILDRFITFWLVMAIGFVLAYKHTMGIGDMIKKK